MRNSEKKISAKSLLTELIKFRSHQRYLDRDLSKIDLLGHASSLNKLKMEQEINLPIYLKNTQDETQQLMHLVADFKERMINTASLFNYNTKKYREEIQTIDSQLKQIDSKNVYELKQSKLEYFQIEESVASLDLSRIICVRNRPLTPLGSAKRDSASKRQVKSAPCTNQQG